MVALSLVDPDNRRPVDHVCCRQPSPAAHGGPPGQRPGRRGRARGLGRQSSWSPRRAPAATGPPGAVRCRRDYRPAVLVAPARVRPRARRGAGGHGGAPTESARGRRASETPSRADGRDLFTGAACTTAAWSRGRTARGPSGRVLLRNEVLPMKFEVWAPNAQTSVGPGRRRRQRSRRTSMHPEGDGHWGSTHEAPPGDPLRLRSRRRRTPSRTRGRLRLPDGPTGPAPWSTSTHSRGPTTPGAACPCQVR